MHGTLAEYSEAQKAEWVEAVTRLAERSKLAASAPVVIGGAWYAVRTEPRAEVHVEMGLKAKGFRPFLPMNVRRSHKKGGGYIFRPRFQGFVFANFNREADEWFHPIKSTAGVIGIVGAPDHEGVMIPLRIPDDYIRKTQAAQSMGLFDERRVGTIKAANDTGQYLDLSSPLFDFMEAVLRGEVWKLFEIE